MTWTPARVAKLKQLDALDYSIGEIALELGVGRGAISSKRAQLGLKRTKEQQRQRRGCFGLRRKAVAAKRAARAKPAPVADLPVKRSPPIVPEFAPAPPSLNVPFAALQSFHCRWETTDNDRVESFRFCGHGNVRGSRYCQYHLERSMPRPAGRVVGKPITVAV